MARLILDENGAKRRFKLNPGKLTIGSGAAATLKLTSPDVAELHAELVFEAGVARLRPRPGVVPPTVGGKAVGAEVVLAAGQTVRIGGASIAVEYDEGEGPKGAAKPGALATPKAGAGPLRGAAPATKGSAPAKRADAGPARVQRTKRETKPGVPGWVTLVLCLVGAAFALYFGKGFLASSTASTFSPVGAEQRFRDFMKDADTKGAELVLVEFENAELTPEWKAKLAEMKAEVGRLAQTASKGAVDMEATKYWQNQLSNFADRFLAGAASRPEARVFVKRLKWFRDTYPNHEQREWVDRMLSRYESIAQLATPSTFKDLEFEVKMLTQAKPRKYPEAFAEIETFLAQATGPERDSGLSLKAKLEAEQQEFFDGELEGAAIYYDKARYPDKFDAMKSFEILAQLVMCMNDPALADDAARRLVKMPESTVLGGYKRDRPMDFERMTQNAIVRERAKELGLVP